jgi:hypothetical protein
MLPTETIEVNQSNHFLLLPKAYGIFGQQKTAVMQNNPQGLRRCLSAPDHQIT